METEQNYVTWILIAFLFILKVEIFIRVLLMMLKENDKKPLPIGKESTRSFLPSSKKVADFLKIELRGKIMKEFCALRAKPYAYILDDDNEKEKKQRNKKK